MEEAHIKYIHEDEVKGLCVSMGNEGKKYNGHREGKEERMNLGDTIKSLHKHFHSYKDDNVRFMKDNEQQDVFNIKLLQSLDRIEKKMDKET
jgi:hypothetical protein